MFLSKTVTLQTSPNKQQAEGTKKNVIALGMYKVGTSQVTNTNKAKSVLTSTRLSATSSVRRPSDRDSSFKNSFVSNTKNSSMIVEVSNWINKKPDVAYKNFGLDTFVTNDEIKNALIAKNVICVSYAKNVLIPCHDNCLAKYKLNVHSNVKRALFTTPKIVKSTFKDTTPVVSKTRFSVRTVQSKSLDTTPVVSKAKIVMDTPLSAKNKVSSVFSVRDSSLRKYVKNKIRTSQMWQKLYELQPNVGWLPVKMTLDLEVAFRLKTCYVRNLEGDDLLTGDCESNLYTISIPDMAASSPICLMSKASSTKSWLWHRGLSHLNFGTINDLTKHDLVDGLSKFKYSKDHLCSACERGKSKKDSHPPKLVPSSHSKLELLHIDLCSPIRVASINGKKYILTILNYDAKIHKIRTDNGTEFKNATLKAHYEKLGIMQQFSTARTPQQNGVVEQRNYSSVKTLIDIEEHEAPLIVTTSEEQTSPISLTEAGEFYQEDSAEFDGKGIRVYKFNLVYVAIIKWVVELSFNAHLLSSTSSATWDVRLEIVEVKVSSFVGISFKSPKEILAEHHVIKTSVKLIESVGDGNIAFVVKELENVKKRLFCIQKFLKLPNDVMSDDYVAKELESVDAKPQSVISEVLNREVSCDKFVPSLYDGESSKLYYIDPKDYPPSSMTQLLHVELCDPPSTQMVANNEMDFSLPNLNESFTESQNNVGFDFDNIDNHSLDDMVTTGEEDIDQVELASDIGEQGVTNLDLHIEENCVADKIQEDIVIDQTPTKEQCEEKALYLTEVNVVNENEPPPAHKVVGKLLRKRNQGKALVKPHTVLPSTVAPEATRPAKCQKTKDATTQNESTIIVFSLDKQEIPLDLSRAPYSRKNKVKLPECQDIVYDLGGETTHTFTWGQDNIVDRTFWLCLMALGCMDQPMWDFRPSNVDWAIAGSYFCDFVMRGDIPGWACNGVRSRVITLYDSLGVPKKETRLWWQK
ncbi:putative ribonuclease H-like domain-containing protein [Tanacetum coccineum]